MFAWTAIAWLACFAIFLELLARAPVFDENDKPAQPMNITGIALGSGSR